MQKYHARKFQQATSDYNFIYFSEGEKKITNTKNGLSEMNIESIWLDLV